MIRTRMSHGANSEAHDVDTREIDAQEIEVYATGSTIITGQKHEAGEHRRPASDGDTAVGDQLRKAVTVLHGSLEHARRFHAKSGPRMGPPATVATTREGAKSEIIRPVLLDPWQAWEVAGSGRLFDKPIPRLSIDQVANPAQSTYPVWTASLRTGWVKHRAARLQVSASPSFNVTVLELIPATPRRTGSRSFLRVGLPVIEELARRLEAARPPHRWKKGNDDRIRDC